MLINQKEAEAYFEFYEAMKSFIVAWELGIHCDGGTWKLIVQSAIDEVIEKVTIEDDA